MCQILPSAAPHHQVCWQYRPAHTFIGAVYLSSGWFYTRQLPQFRKLVCFVSPFWGPERSVANTAFEEKRTMSWWDLQADDVVEPLTSTPIQLTQAASSTQASMCHRISFFRHWVRGSAILMLLGESCNQMKHLNHTICYGVADSCLILSF